MKRFIQLLFLVCAVVLAPLVAVSPANATAPGRNGRLTFMRPDSDGFWQVWVSNADLTGARQLTREPADSGWPVWSPDGKSIAFDSDRSDPDLQNDPFINDVFTMSPDGSNVTKLTDSRGESGDAAWSPDGRSIAFDANRGDYPHLQGIYVMRRDGTRIHRITSVPQNAAYDKAPRFSPDGKRLSFTRFSKDQDFESSAVFTIDLHGRRLRQLTSFAIGAGDSDWSPDGSRIVFEASNRAAPRGDVYVVGVNGAGLRDLTNNLSSSGSANGSADPVWSPDGTKILFLQGIVTNGQFVLGLATMGTDGSHRHFISTVESHQPDWESVSQSDSNSQVQNQ